jgi:peptide chain release factor subunit 1
MVGLTDKIKLKKFINKLKLTRGRHTELISVYLPAGSDLTKMIGTLSDEQGTATNIKDKNTGKSVQQALERMIRTMRVIETTPKNGLAIFSGNVSEKDNMQDFQVFWVEPPEPVPLKLYRCEQKFVTAPLEEMNANESTYALIAIDKGEATVGLLVGSSLKVIKNMTSTVPGKFKAGGQSAQRFARIREGAAVEFYKRVADVCIQEFTFMKELKGIIIGGPGTTKINFADGNYLNQQMKDKILGIKDITYTNAFGLKELLDVSTDLLSDTEVLAERKALQKFFETLGKNTNMVVYGMKNTVAALKIGAIEDLIVIDGCCTDDELDELCELQESSRANLKLLTDKTPEGVQMKGLTGIGGILRYPIDN